MATYGEVAGPPQPMPGRATDPTMSMDQMLPITASPRLQVPPGFSGASTPQGASLSKSLPILGQQQEQTGSAGALKRQLTIAEKPGKVAPSVESGHADGTASIFRAEPEVKPNVGSGHADGTASLLRAEPEARQSETADGTASILRAGPEAKNSPVFRRPLIPYDRTHETMLAGAFGQPGYVSLSVTPAGNSQGSNRGMPSTVNDGVIAQLLVQIQQLQEKVDRLTRLPSTQRVDIATPVKRGDSDDEEEVDDLKDIHFKDIEPPTKYDGKGWKTWSQNFKNFLERRDPRWAKVLEAIADKKRVTAPLTEVGKAEICKEAKILKGSLPRKFTAQLFDYLQNFTAGEPLAVIQASGRMESFEAWRFLSDQAQSLRGQDLHEEQRRLMKPMKSTTESLMKNIAIWERDVQEFQSNSEKNFDETTKIIVLEGMCPDKLCEVLQDKADTKEIKTYAQYKQAASVWVTRQMSKKKTEKAKISLMASQGQEGETEEVEHQEELNAVLDCLIQNMPETEEKMHLAALVKTKFQKKGKGGGKGGKNGDGTPMEVDHSNKDCYHCGEKGHIAANCPSNKGEGKGEPKGGKGKGKLGKGGEGGKGKGKYGKGGKPWVRTWAPTLRDWKGYYPGPSPTEWAGYWKQAQEGKGTYTGKINAFEKQKFAAFQEQGWHEGATEWPSYPTDAASALASLMGAGGKMAKLQAKPKAGVATKNRYSELEDLSEEPVPAVCTHECCSHKQVRFEPKIPEVNCEPSLGLCTACADESDDEEDELVVTKTPKTPPRKMGNTKPNRGNVAAALLGANTDPRKGTYELMEFIKAPSKNIEKRANRARRAGMQGETMDPKVIKEMLQTKEPQTRPKAKLAPMSLRIKDTTPQKLAPLGSQPPEKREPTGPNGWEIMSAIVDSGATVSAIRPKVGRGYKVEESEGSKAGLMFQLADDSEIPCLGMKKMAVLTPEGHLRGMAPACADVGDTLQSVRQLLGAKHCVLFGLGENEDEHLIINKLTGEVSRLRDDGVNYLQDLLIVPPDEILSVQKVLAEGQSPFGRLGAN